MQMQTFSFFTCFIGNFSQKFPLRKKHELFSRLSIVNIRVLVRSYTILKEAINTPFLSLVLRILRSYSWGKEEADLVCIHTAAASWPVSGPCDKEEVQLSSVHHIPPRYFVKRVKIKKSTFSKWAYFNNSVPNWVLLKKKITWYIPISLIKGK